MLSHLIIELMTEVFVEQSRLHGVLVITRSVVFHIINKSENLKILGF